MRRVAERVPLAEAKRRALAYLRANGKHVKASSVAAAIWPGAKFKSQGAGASASRVLVALEKDGEVRWRSDGSDWGWEARRT